MQIAERPDDLLHVVPRRHAGLDFGLQGLGDIHSVGPPVWTPEAQGEMRAMLGPVGTVASARPQRRYVSARVPNTMPGASW
jgi:hypothetical protein